MTDPFHSQPDPDTGRCTCDWDRETNPATIFEFDPSCPVHGSPEERD